MPYRFKRGDIIFRLEDPYRQIAIVETSTDEFCMSLVTIINSENKESIGKKCIIIASFWDKVGIKHIKKYPYIVNYCDSIVQELFIQ